MFTTSGQVATRHKHLATAIVVERRRPPNAPIASWTSNPVSHRAQLHEERVRRPESITTGRGLWIAARHLRWRLSQRPHRIALLGRVCSCRCKPCTTVKMTRMVEKYDSGLFKLCVGVDSAFIRGYARPLSGVGDRGDAMRFVAAIGLAALTVGCAAKLELADGDSYARQAATRLAQGPDEIEAAAASPAQTAKPAARNARSLPLRVQTVSAHESNAEAQNNLAVPALRGQSSIAVPTVATVASPGIMQRDGGATPQAAGVVATDRTPGQALDPPQETALNPAREAALSPAREPAAGPAGEAALSLVRETVPGPAREAAFSPVGDIAPSRTRETTPGPARGIALAPAPDAASNDGLLQASACIRNNIKAAYRSSDTVDQATSFLMKICFAPFSSAIASDEASAKTVFRGLVFQEISPVEWLQAMEESAPKSR
jgi:hypothetical protein